MKNQGYITSIANIEDYVDNLKYEITFLQEIGRDLNVNLNIMLE